MMQNNVLYQKHTNKTVTKAIHILIIYSQTLHKIQRIL